MSEDAKEPVIMFHGTTSVALQSILERGLRADIPDDMKTSSALDTLGHLGALTGIYLAADLELALSHAQSAARLRGGDPVVITIEVDESQTVPDEGHVLEFLGNYGEDLGRFFELDGFLNRWHTDLTFRDAVVEKIAADLQVQFSPASVSNLTVTTRGMLHFAFDPMTEQDFAEATTSRGHVLVPNLLESGLSADGGIERYRELMDELCLSMRSPGTYSDLEAHSVRVPSNILFDGGTKIIAIGSEENLTKHFRGEITPEASAILLDWGWDGTALAP